jgi:RHS repeat-associated protein
MLAAAKQETLSLPLVQTPEGVLPLAAFEGVAENSPQGFARTHHTLHQGFEGVNSTTALGIEPVWLVNGVRSRCTGKERDTESSLDYFVARYYTSAHGRFLSPDEFSGGPVDAFSANDPLPPGPLPYADITNPQSLNKYAYTYSNPLRYTDPTGHCPTCTAPPPVAEPPAYDPNVVRKLLESAGEVTKTGSKVVRFGGIIGAGAAVIGGAKAVIETLTDNYVEENLRQQEQDAMLSEMASEQNKKKDQKDDVVTSTGQKADRHGNKLGPSGKPEVHEKDHKSKKEAKEAARREGQGEPVNHPSPKKGKPHYHSTDKDGKKRPGSTHHNYPQQ